MKIKNWKKFQHFKNRKPPWIKLYREIVYQADIGMISDWHFRLLISLWLLASEDKNLDGTLPSIEQISFVMRKTESEIAESLLALEKWLILTNSDIKMISGLYQNDHSEKEKEIEIRDLNFSNEKFLIGDTVSSVGSKKDPLPPLLALTPEDPLTSLDHPKRKSKKTKTNNKQLKCKKTGPTTDGSRVWDAYARAYEERYDIAPVRNTRQNSICKKLVERVGASDAVGVAEYYPSVRNGYDSARGHSLAMLLADCEKHVTAWKTGRQITQTKAREDDRLKATGDVWDEIIAEHQERDKHKQPVAVGESTVEAREQQK